jgi:succinate dehydrogenase hydrophobic anchor subunit
MRESKLRILVFASGIIALVLIPLHLIMVTKGEGLDISYSAVTNRLNNIAYSISLMLLLFFTLLHSWLGLRRTLLDTSIKPRNIKIILGIISIVFIIIVYLGIDTIVTMSFRR